MVKIEEVEDEVIRRMAENKEKHDHLWDIFTMALIDNPDSEGVIVVYWMCAICQKSGYSWGIAE